LGCDKRLDSAADRPNGLVKNVSLIPILG